MIWNWWHISHKIVKASVENEGHLLLYTLNEMTLFSNVWNQMGGIKITQKVGMVNFQNKQKECTNLFEIIALNHPRKGKKIV